MVELLPATTEIYSSVVKMMGWLKFEDSVKSFSSTSATDSSNEWDWNNNSNRSSKSKFCHMWACFLTYIMFLRRGILYEFVSNNTLNYKCDEGRTSRFTCNLRPSLTVTSRPKEYLLCLKKKTPYEANYKFLDLCH